MINELKITNGPGLIEPSDGPNARTAPQLEVIVVDDQFTGRKILEELVYSIDANLKVRSFAEPLSALQRAAQNAPQLVLTDYKMPGMDGVEFTRRFRALPGCDDVPLIMVTVVDDRRIRYRALEAGATDFLSRPIDQYECRARCRNLLTLHRQRLIIKNRARWLEEQVAVATRQVRSREEETLLRLARAGEYRDEDTGSHVVRIARLAYLLARSLNLSEMECYEIELAAPMHDIGKIGIPDSVLLKPGRHTHEETLIMRTHTTIGHEILRDSPSKYIELGATIALSHHERFDGAGYPAGLSGADIPLCARLVSITDVFDALMSPRPYKRPWDIDRALAYIAEHSGTQFDPDCVDAFVRCERAIREIYRPKSATADDDIDRGSGQ